ncbi:MAG: carbamoyl phosphate synthase small subunit [Oscillospiraceae bacterium]|jgi:carbamoyl-phosphate synthase small subunit
MERALYLILENGMVFKGKSFGARGEATAEVVFTTGMTGYLETLTDQGYHGQIVVQTFPLIGSYGVITSDFESKQIGPTAYIVKKWCQSPSNFRCEGDIDTFLKSKNIVGLWDIDTRALTKAIREHGVMNGMITEHPEKASLDAIRKHRTKQAVSHVSVLKPFTERSEKGAYHVALWDYGYKENIARELKLRGCDVTVCPHNISAEALLALRPDGIVLSNGPGDPTENVEVIAALKSICQEKIPIFGICLGHQLLALANGCRISKLKYGHRGANQPVKNRETGRIYISSQNHGYVVQSDSIHPAIAKELYVNVNDGTCEGIAYCNLPAFSVQFYPEACGGPHDTRFLFDQFITMMETRKNAVR